MIPGRSRGTTLCGQGHPFLRQIALAHLEKHGLPSFQCTLLRFGGFNPSDKYMLQKMLDHETPIFWGVRMKKPNILETTGPGPRLSLACKPSVGPNDRRCKTLQVVAGKCRAGAFRGTRHCQDIRTVRN